MKKTRLAAATVFLAALLALWGVWVLSWYVLTADSTDPQLQAGVAASCTLS